MNIARSVARWLALAALLVHSPVHANDLTGATATVRQFQDGLLYVMRNADTLGYEGRRRSLSELITATFDREQMARHVLGEYWQGMAPATRDDVGRLMFDFATSMLARNFDSYDDERIETDFTRELKSGRVRVRSYFHFGDGEAVDADFVLHLAADGRWRIVDFWFSGVSGAQIHRSEFQSIIRSGGTDALLSELKQKIANLAAAS